MSQNYNTSELQSDELTLHLTASGVVKLTEKVKNGGSPTLPYPKELQRGLDRLVKTSLLQKKTPPQGIPDLLSWCQRPLAEWPLELPEEAGTADKLLDRGMPTEICEEWAIASPDLEAELTQKKLLLNAIAVCKSADAPDSYVAFRRLLIEKPVLTEFELLQQCHEPVLEKLAEQLQTAYEPAPESAVVGGQFHCCSNCGNLMLRAIAGDLVCTEERCRTKSLGKPGTQIPQNQGVFWLKRGLRRFVAAPGRAEVRLLEKLEKLGKLQQVELWPNFDSYDLRIVFPDGEAWAIDVKDWRNPFLLAKKVREQQPPIPSAPSWQQAYFVFPDDRKQQRSDYRRAFLNHCRLPKNVKAKFEKELIKEVKNKLGGKN